MTWEKRCRQAVKALVCVPDTPPARYPHLMRESCAGRERGVDSSVQDRTGRILRWVNRYDSINKQVGADAQIKETVE